MAGRYHTEHVIQPGELLPRLRGSFAASYLRRIDLLPVRVGYHANPTAFQESLQSLRPGTWAQIKMRQVSQNRVDCQHAVFSIGADDPGRASLDPARNIKAGNYVPTIHHTPVPVGDDGASVVKRNPGQGDATVADTAKQDTAREFLRFASFRGDLP